MWKCYVAFIRSVLLNGFPCVCNSFKYLLKRLENKERRVMRIIDDDICKPSILCQEDSLCVNLFNQILSNSEHPMRKLFTQKSEIGVTRFSKTLQRPFAKTSSSFIKYCTWCLVLLFLNVSFYFFYSSMNSFPL